MPSLAQLQAEPWWNREVVTAELDRLGDRLCSHFGRPRSAFGSKGDENHMRGAHRSQEWILNSQFCTDGDYTVQSGLTDWQRRHIAGGDFTPGVWGTSSNRQLMAQITKRLIDAAKAGDLNGVIEIGGTLNGTTATGWHVVQRRVLSFDSSHRDHVHLTLDRRALEDRAVMDNIFNVMIGVVDVAPSDVQEIWQNFLVRNQRNMADNLGETWQAAQEARALAEQANAKLDALTIPAPAPVDPAQLAAAVLAAVTEALADPQVLVAVAKAVNDDAHQRLES